MLPILAALLTVVAGSAVWLLITGLRPAPAPSTPRRNQLTRSQRKQLQLIAIGAGIGLLLWILTGYIAAVIAAPVLALLAPQLIPRSTEKSTIARLTAMEEWTRSLVGLLGASSSIEQAIIASRSSAPEALKEEIGMLAARLQSGISIEQALTQFGDDLDDTTGDLLTGSLILGTRRRGSGLARLLEGTAETIADDVAARRQIEADRAKPRANARFITVIAVAVIAIEFLFNPAYVEPYRTSLGQIILIALAGLFLAALWWMNIVARDPKGQRLLRPTGDAS